MKAVVKRNIKTILKVPITLGILMCAFPSFSQITFKLKKTDLISKSDLILKSPVQDSIQLKPNTFHYNKQYHHSLGIMCHLENKMSKASQTNIRMRLGTVEHVDRMEMKKHSLLKTTP